MGAVGRQFKPVLRQIRRSKSIGSWRSFDCLPCPVPRRSCRRCRPGSIGFHVHGAGQDIHPGPGSSRAVAADASCGLVDAAVLVASAQGLAICRQRLRGDGYLRPGDGVGALRWAHRLPVRCERTSNDGVIGMDLHRNPIEPPEAADKSDQRRERSASPAAAGLSGYLHRPSNNGFRADRNRNHWRDSREAGDSLVIWAEAAGGCARIMNPAHRIPRTLKTRIELAEAGFTCFLRSRLVTQNTSKCT